MSSWTTLPRAWKLEDVQAVLNVVITALSGITVYVFSRCCWSLSARVAAKGKPLLLSSLLSLSTPGEAFDVLVLLKSHALQHWKILAQSLVVITFSITTVLSGPIAKYSTRLSHVVSSIEVEGLLAGRTDNSIGVAQVAWNDTQTSLDNANFPLDQLLDYLPGTRYPWVYHPDEWNNSWTMNCVPTESTPIDLTLTSNCSSFVAKFGDPIFQIFPSIWTSDQSWYDNADFYVNDTFIKDLLIPLYAANYSDWDRSSGPFGTYRRIDMSMATLHLHAVQRNESDDEAPCRFAAGPVGYASYTRIDCVVKRAHDNVTDPTWVAFPDIHDVFNIASSMKGNWFTRFKQESMGDSDITTIRPRDLQRFYQTYMITKDTQLKRPVKRQLSVKAIRVQLSIVFPTVSVLVALCNCVGVAFYGLVLLTNAGTMGSVPQSKLDWLLQSIVSKRPMSGSVQTQAIPPPHSAGFRVTEDRKTKAERKRARFEEAIYDASWARDASPSPDITALSPEFPDKMADPRHPSSFWMAGPPQAAQL